mmetsp:Transcript_25114/g.53190  ORF Transcript_25114/g.53190 Transcript_25114/m.53190 type:complete len:457 (+) Transcript_25114:144-1514(+)
MRLSCVSPRVPVLVALVSLATFGGAGAGLLHADDDHDLQPARGLGADTETSDSNGTATTTSSYTTTTFTTFNFALTLNTSNGTFDTSTTTLTTSTYTGIQATTTTTTKTRAAAPPGTVRILKGSMHLDVNADFLSSGDEAKLSSLLLRALVATLALGENIATITGIGVLPADHGHRRLHPHPVQAQVMEMRYELRDPPVNITAEYTQDLLNNTFMAQANSVFLSEGLTGQIVGVDVALPLEEFLAVRGEVGNSGEREDDESEGEHPFLKDSFLTPLPLWLEIAIVACILSWLGFGCWLCSRRRRRGAVAQEEQVVCATPAISEVRQSPKPWPSPPPIAQRLFPDDGMEEGRGFGEEQEVVASVEGSEGPSLPDERTILAWLHSVYGRYNPGKVSQVEALFHAHRGRERELIEKVVTKYRLGTEAHQSMDWFQVCCIVDGHMPVESCCTNARGMARQ